MLNPSNGDNLPEGLAQEFAPATRTDASKSRSITGKLQSAIQRTGKGRSFDSSLMSGRHPSVAYPGETPNFPNSFGRKAIVRTGPQVVKGRDLLQPPTVYKQEVARPSKDRRQPDMPVAEAVLLIITFMAMIMAMTFQTETLLIGALATALIHLVFRVRGSH